MMSERNIEFRVGIFALVGLTAAAVMVFQFGRFQRYLRPRYTVTIHFRSAPGLAPSTPVRRSGILVGSVATVGFDDHEGGVIARASIEQGVRLPKDSRARLVSTFLGDSSIEFVPGRAAQALGDGDSVLGECAADPFAVAGRIEQTVTTAIDSFQQTSREWQTVGRNVNRLLETNQGNLHVVVERSAEALARFSRTMELLDKTLEATGRVVADPRTQENLHRTLAALPQLTVETQRTVAAVRSAVEKVDENLRNLGAVTAPFSKRGVTMATHLESTLANLESLSDQLAQFTKTVNSGDGSIRKLAADPQLYVNLSRSADSLAVLLQNLEPIVRDLRVFSDKLARHPEIIGVSGAIRGSSGLKDPEEAEPGRVSLMPRNTRRQ